MKGVISFVVFISLFIFTAGCTTGAMWEDTAPSNVTSSYENGATDVTPDAVFTITFVKAVNTSTVTTSTFFLVEGSSYSSSESSLERSRDDWTSREAHPEHGQRVLDSAAASLEQYSLSSGAKSFDSSICDPSRAISGHVECSSETQCSFVPDSQLDSEASYTLCLTDEIFYEDGNRYPGYQMTFTTADVLAPTVSSVSPQDGATNIAVNTSVQAVFSEEMEAPSIDTIAFTLSSGGTSIDGSVSYNADTKTATFTPSSNLSSYAQYTATIASSVKDDAGNTMEADYTWSFTTSDIIAPTVTSVSPADGATGVSIDTLINAVFTETMDSTSITTDTFTLSNSVTGIVSYTDATRTATFDPTSDLSYYTDYTATVTTGAKDAHGVPVASNYAWTFRTEIGPTSAIAAGYNHVLALKTDGTVWAWGSNTYGQLGDGTDFDKNSPVQVSGLTGVSAIACGYAHSIALKTDGTVWAWGYNLYGQLGDGTTTDKYTPVQVSGLTGVSAVAGGFYHNIALKDDDTVWAWGRNAYGQLGDGTTTDKYTPVQISGLTGVSAIAGGGNHSIALKTGGTVWAWGNNSYGQLGDGTIIQKTTPVQVSQVSGLTEAIAIAAGGSHSIALKNDGTVWTWGYNYYGALGDGTIIQKTTPVQVSGLTGVSAIAGGAYHSIALKNDGTVRAWGYNLYGHLGDGTTTDRYTPVQVSGLSGVSAIAGGLQHSVALNGDGTVMWTWGFNYYGQLGDGTATYYGYTPKQVSELTGVSAVEGGENFRIALKNDGTVWGWGKNDYGQLGDGTLTNRNTPAQVSGLTNVIAIASGDFHSVAAKNDGTVWAWGRNNHGQLGDNSTTDRTTPVQVSGLTGVIDVACGWNHSLALKNDNTVWAWGRNSNGQIGDNTVTTPRKTPVQVHGYNDVGFLTGVTEIDGGYGHSIARKSDGTVWTWGRNVYGELGDGTITQSTTPVQVHGPGDVGFLTDVINVAGGGILGIALKSDGTVWAWGQNSSGQLGDGTTTQRTTPVQASGITGVADIDGYYATIARKTDGTVWAWGSNTYGQLGDGTTVNRYTPVQVSGLTGVSTVTIGGSNQAMAVKADGTAWEWGWNTLVPMRDGTYPYSTTPVQVDWPE